MKAILLSIQPKWLEKILNGEKTIEIRKSIPKDFKGWCYLYCTKGDKNNNLIKYNDKLNYEIVKRWQTIDVYGYKNGVMCGQDLNGKVVARFWFEEYTKLKFGRWVNQENFNYYGWNYEHKPLIGKSLLSEVELNSYAQGKRYIYAWHIKNLEIFDKPKELVEFYKVGYMPNAEIEFRDRPDIWLNQGEYYRITKPPQSWQYVEVVE